MNVKHAAEVESQVVRTGEKTSIQVLISAQEGPNFAMRRFTIEPGGVMPAHTNIVEHEQYVLRGTASIGIGEVVFEAREGDVVFIPQGVPHWYKNTGEERFVFLCIIPNKPDEIRLVGKDC
jgi:quercetin dioxygenase-like cupin family protein